MPAWMNRKMLSISSSTSPCSSSRKYSAMVSAASPTRNRAPGGSFIWPNIITMCGSTPASFMSLIQLLAFATAFADAAEDAHALLMADHVVNHLGQQHRLADTRAAEEPGLAAPFQRDQHVDHLDAGLEDLGRGGSLASDGGAAMDRTPFDIRRRRLVVDRRCRRRRTFARAVPCRPAPATARRCPPPCVPRASPWVGVSAMPRTRCASSCAITSITICPVLHRHAATSRSPASPRRTRTSTTLPRTETTPSTACSLRGDVRVRRGSGCHGRWHQTAPAISSSGSPACPARAGRCTACARSACPSPSASGRRPSSPSCGSRSTTSCTRWKRSRSFCTRMSNGVVMVPSSL